MNVRYVKMNPSGNTTVFVLDPVPADKRAAVVDAIMSHTGPGAEQVGFITAAPEEAAGWRMDMAGGEFCGNATRSFAAWLQLCPEGSLPHDFTPAEIERPVRVSGATAPLNTYIRSIGKENACYVTVAMSKPERIIPGNDPWFGNYTLVVFNGISHIVLWDREPKDEDVEKARPFLAQFDAIQECFGLMYYNTTEQFMRPLVCVEDPYTLVWENSCGSGSCALASALTTKAGQSLGTVSIRQPGGTLTVDVTWNDGIEKLVLGGDVEISVLGNLYF